MERSTRLLAALSRPATTTSSLRTCSVGRTCPFPLLAASQLRSLHTSPSVSATPLSPTIAGPPPLPPAQDPAYPQDRVNRKRKQAELLKQGQVTRVNPGKPTTTLQKRFWKNVKVVETTDGLQIHLDTRPVRTATKASLTLPHNKRALATAIALEWDQLISAQQALKHHYIPMTSLTSRAMDVAAADAENNTKIRDMIVEMAMRYLGTDTLLCWAPEHNIHEPEPTGQKSLRSRQSEMAEPIIAYLRTHVFPGVNINPILGEDSIMPTPQPELTQQVIRGWVAGLPAWELAALERGILASKSLLVAVRLVVEWSKAFAHLREGSGGKRMFGIEQAAEAASLEVLFQTEQWGEVEDTHDVEHADVRRQLGSVILLVS
jgi:ATP synthase F1 complex assembly factor 2